MKKRILITGASGTVGINTINNLIDNKDVELTLFDLNTPRAKKRLKPYRDKARIVWGDISEKNALIPACMNQDVVIHLAAIIPPMAEDYPPLAYKVNVIGTKNLIDLLEMLSPQAHIIYASSVAVYGDRLKNPWISTTDPLKPSEGDEYGKTKIIAENLIRASSLTWTIMRLSAVFGVKNHKISKMLFHMPLDTPIEIITPEDAGRAFARAALNTDKIKNRIFNLGGGEKARILYKDFLDRSFRIFGLGGLDFPPQAFAKRNFHCGYFKDSNELEAILHFQQDDIETYFKRVEASVTIIQKFFTYLFHKMIKASLLKKSEPLKALKNGDKKLMKRFFGLTD